MPVLEVWNAQKRYRVQAFYEHGLRRRTKPIAFKDNTQMLFGDAKQLSRYSRAPIEVGSRNKCELN